MFVIKKKFGPFPAAHYLTGLPDGHQCGRLHGHNYEVEVEIHADDVDQTGFVVDYGELAPLREYLTARMDHRYLNEEFDFNPTAENLAEHIFQWVEGTQDWNVVAVRVSETPGKTESEYRRDPEPAVLQVSIVETHEHHETNINVTNAAPARSQRQLVNDYQRGLSRVRDTFRP